jgi:hypothetical protein
MIYYFELDKNGDPLEYSNSRGIMPRSLPNRRFKQYVPTCCIDPNISSSRGHWIIQLDGKGRPISGTLHKVKVIPRGLKFMEVEGINCCTNTPIPPDPDPIVYYLNVENYGACDSDPNTFRVTAVYADGVNVLTGTIPVESNETVTIPMNTAVISVEYADALTTPSMIFPTGFSYTSSSNTLAQMTVLNPPAPNGTAYYKVGCVPEVTPITHQLRVNKLNTCSAYPDFKVTGVEIDGNYQAINPGLVSGQHLSIINNPSPYMAKVYFENAPAQMELSASDMTFDNVTSTYVSYYFIYSTTSKTYEITLGCNNSTPPQGNSTIEFTGVDQDPTTTYRIIVTEGTNDTAGQNGNAFSTSGNIIRNQVVTNASVINVPKNANYTIYIQRSGSSSSFGPTAIGITGSATVTPMTTTQDQNSSPYWTNIYHVNIGSTDSNIQINFTPYVPEDLPL